MSVQREGWGDNSVNSVLHTAGQLDIGTCGGWNSMHSPCADSSLPGLLVEKGIGHTLSPLDTKLLATVSYRERERQFL